MNKDWLMKKVHKDIYLGRVLASGIILNHILKS